MVSSCDRVTHTSLIVLHLYAVQDYQVNIYFRQTWKDPRLRYDPPNAKLQEIRLGVDTQKQIWIPDTFFRNEKRAQFHEVTVDNRLMRVTTTGKVWYVSK